MKLRTVDRKDVHPAMSLHREEKMNLLFILSLLLAAASKLALLSAEEVMLCVPNSRERSCDGLAECSRNNTVLLQDLKIRKEDFFGCSSLLN